MYTLYYLPGACSLAIHALINELGQEVKLENVSVPQGEPRSPEFLKVNPRGQVPVLVDGDLVLREGGAIINYLLDKHNSNMLPKSQPERAQSLEWLMFANATLHPAYARIFFINRIIKDENAKEEAINAGIEQINTGLYCTDD
jgi:glutathione S-transferase